MDQSQHQHSAEEDPQPHDNQQQQQQEQNQSKWKKIEKPQKCLNLYMIDFNQCDGKKCTGRKMQRFGLLKSIKDHNKKKFKGVVLSAFGDRCVSMEDIDICLKYGICVIDCSWNRIEETNSFRFKNERILPYVVAGNPVNYGKPFQLSCVQALATALCAVGYLPQAEYIMSKFGWADGFWSINESIRDYSECKTLEQLEEMSKKNEEAVNSLDQGESESESQSDSESSSGGSEQSGHADEPESGQKQQKQAQAQEKQGNNKLEEIKLQESA